MSAPLTESFLLFLPVFSVPGKLLPFRTVAPGAPPLRRISAPGELPTVLLVVSAPRTSPAHLLPAPGPPSSLSLLLFAPGTPSPSSLLFTAG